MEITRHNNSSNYGAKLLQCQFQNAIPIVKAARYPSDESYETSSQELREKCGVKCDIQAFY